MTLADPKKQPPRPPGFSILMTSAVVAAFLIGSVLQEVRWRGGMPSVAPSPLESKDQQLKLGEVAFRDGNNALALSLFDRLAAKHDPAAEYWLAHMTEWGIGVPKDPAKSITLYANAAAEGSVPAQSRLGEIYLNGNLVTPDYAKAFELLGSAARSGNPRAAMLLGQMYRSGLGTKTDPTESYAWSEVAVVEGLSFAKIEREAAFASMSADDRQKGATRAADLVAEIKKKSATAAKS